MLGAMDDLTSDTGLREKGKTDAQIAKEEAGVAAKEQEKADTKHRAASQLQEKLAMAAAGSLAIAAGSERKQDHDEEEHGQEQDEKDGEQDEQNDEQDEQDDNARPSQPWKRLETWPVVGLTMNLELLDLSAPVRKVEDCEPRDLGAMAVIKRKGCTPKSSAPCSC